MFVHAYFQTIIHAFVLCFLQRGAVYCAAEHCNNVYSEKGKAILAADKMKALAEVGYCPVSLHLCVFSF